LKKGGLLYVAHAYRLDTDFIQAAFECVPPETT
jgi:hypothetical protein